MRLTKPFRLFAAVAFAVAGTAYSQPFTFTKVADTATAVPNGTGNFSAFTNMVSIDGSGNVGFGENSATNKGIYFWNGSALTRAADLNTAIPDGSGNFTGFATFGNGMASGQIAFRGNGASSQAGLYTYSAGSLTRVADTSTTIPNGTGSFTGFTTGFLRDGHAYFIASGASSQQGIYVSDGTTVTRLVDKTSTVPSIGGTYSWSSQIAVDNGNLSFWSSVTGSSLNGGASTPIIGSYSGGTLRTLVTIADTAPGAGAAFTGFTSPSGLDDSTVVFRGAYTDGNGLYSVPLEGGAIALIADTTFLVPGTGVNFTSFGAPVADSGLVVFQASYTGGSGLFYYADGSINSILTTADTLDGKTMTSLFVSPNGFVDGQLAIRANFSDASVGIYVTQLAAIPEPYTYAVLAGGLALVAVILRRRRTV